MRKNAGCRIVGYETFCVNGCCDSAALMSCVAGGKRQARKKTGK